MAAQTDTYVDPSIAASSGTGSAIDPYGDLQYCLDTETRDTTNGTRINVKAGTAEVLAAALDFSTFGTPTNQGNQTTFRGYTATAGDGGIGEIDCNSFSFIDSTTIDCIDLVDLAIHNSGSNRLIQLDDYCNFVNCEFHNSTATLLEMDNYCSVYNCHFHNGGTYGVSVNVGTTIAECYFANGTNDFTDTIRASAGCSILRNILTLDGSTNGIMAVSPADIAHNTMICNGGTGAGIVTINNSMFTIRGNLIEGFSGAGGDGINLSGQTSKPTVIYRDNAVYNCTNDYVAYTSRAPIIESGNETLTSSPFAKTGADSFSNRWIYFTPLNVGNVLGGAVSGADKGAVQRTGQMVPIYRSNSLITR